MEQIVGYKLYGNFCPYAEIEILQKSEIDSCRKKIVLSWKWKVWRGKVKFIQLISYS